MTLLGIGRPPGKMDPVGFVLRPFTKQEREEVRFLVLLLKRKALDRWILGSKC